MLSQKNSSSPFQGSTDNQKSQPEEFLIRTMKDDLLELSKNGAPLSKKDEQAETRPAMAPVFPEKKLSPLPELPKAAPVTPENNFPNKNQNPFLGQTQPVEAKKEAPVVEKQEEKKIEIVELPVNKNETPNKSKDLTNTLYKVVLSIVIILILSILGLGGYYFWLTKSSSQETALPQTEVPIEEVPVQTNEEPAAEPVVEKYSTQNPNYLPLDLATMSDSDISSAINNVFSDLKDEELSSLFEFIPVDKNNNPIAFPIFAIAAKLNLSPTLLSTLGETVSFYTYNDKGIQRAAIAVNIKNQDSFANELAKQQPTLIKDASFLFFGATPETTIGKFSDSTYKNNQIKFINLNKEQTLSLDYTTLGSQFIIGTSKNTLRAVLDKLSATTNATAETSAPTEPVQQ